MTEKQIKSRMTHKHDVEANWKKAINFIPLAGEIIVYDADDSHSQIRLKMGDGETKVNDLPFYTNNDSYFGICETLEGIPNKVITLTNSDNFELKNDLAITIRFTDGLKTFMQIDGEITLNINNTGNKILYIGGALDSTGTLNKEYYLLKKNGFLNVRYNETIDGWVIAQTDFVSNSDYSFRALKAERDDTGNLISSTYFPRKGGTFTGDITAPSVTAEELKDTYISLHSEDDHANILPFLFNDISFLLEKGGSVEVYTTTDTDYTIPELTHVKDNASYSYKLFNGKPDYYYVTLDSLKDVTVIDLALHKTFTWNTRFYIDFGGNRYGFGNIKVYSMNTTIDNTTYSLKKTLNKTGSIVNHYNTVFSDQNKGFNALRIVLSNPKTVTNRIAEIGLIAFDSSGLANTVISVGGNSSIIGDLAPSNTEKINLGSSSKKWNNIYAKEVNATTFTGNLTGTASSAKADGNGNNIIDTYATKDNLKEYVPIYDWNFENEDAWNYFGGYDDMKTLAEDVASIAIDKRVSPSGREYYGYSDIVSAVSDLEDWNEAFFNSDDFCSIEEISNEFYNKENDIDRIRPEWYGAKGDGVTDDTSAIQQAIVEAKNSGKVLYFPEKIYICGNLSAVNVPNLKIEGKGTLKHNGSTDNINWIYFQNCSNLNISGIKFDANYAAVRAIKITDSDNYKITNIEIFDVGNLETTVDTIGISIINSHYGVIEDVNINRVYSLRMASGIHLGGNGVSNDDGTTTVDHSTIPQHTRIERPVIKDIAPVDDADGIKILGGDNLFDDTFDADLTVSNGYFEDCRKRALKFQAPGCMSINNTMKFNEQPKFVIDFQRGKGKTINDHIILNYQGTNDIATGMGFVMVSVWRGNVDINNIKVEATADTAWIIDKINAGSSTSSVFCRIYNTQTPSGKSIAPVKIHNCDIDGVGRFIMLDSTKDTPLSELYITDVKCDMLMGYPIGKSSDTSLDYLYIRNLRTTQIKSTDFIQSGITLNKCDIDLCGVDISKSAFIRRGTYYIVKCRSNTRPGFNYDINNNKLICYSTVDKNPMDMSTWQGAIFSIAKKGDICYNNTSSYSNKGYVNVGYICTHDVGYSEEVIEEDGTVSTIKYARGKWEPLRYYTSNVDNVKNNTILTDSVTGIEYKLTMSNGKLMAEVNE